MREMARNDRHGLAAWARPLRRWATGLALGGAALGAGASEAQSLDIFGAPPPAASAPASIKSSAPATPDSKATPAKPAASPSPRTERKEAERKTVERKEVKAQEPKPRRESARATDAPGEILTNMTPAPVEQPTAAASAAPVKEPAAASDPLRALAVKLRHPLGIGFGLAAELGVLWLILRWRARRGKRGDDAALPEKHPGKSKAPSRRRPHPMPAPADAEQMEHDNTPIALLLNDADAMPRIDLSESALLQSVQADEMPRLLAHAATHPLQEDAPPEDAPIFTPEPEASPSHDTPPPTRGVFKPSSLFSRIEPAAPMPLAPPDPLPPADPLNMEFAALRLSMTLSRVELRFRITLRNVSPDPLGAIRLETCMGTTGGDLPQTAQDHGLVALMPGEECTITGEWRVPLNMLPTLRLGSMRLFVGAARIVTTIEDDPIHPPGDKTFLIGLPEDGGRLAPIPLDGSAHIYDSLIVQSIAPDEE